MSGEHIDGKVEEGLEARGLIDVEGDGLYDRYLLALGLLIAVIIAFAFSGDGNVGRLVSVVLEGLTLLVILRSSRVHQRVLLAASILVGLALVACVVAILLDDTAGRRGPVHLGGRARRSSDRRSSSAGCCPTTPST